MTHPNDRGVDQDQVVRGRLRAEVIKNAAMLSLTANGCLVHVVGKHLVCFDTLGDANILTFNSDLTIDSS